MSQPVALYAARVPPGGILVPAVPNAAATFRVTMAAIDPDASPEFSEEFGEDKKPRATLKLIRAPDGMYEDDDESDDEDYEDVGSDEDESDDESNGGPSDPAKAKMAKKAAALKELEDAMDEDESDDGEDDEDLKAAISKLIKGKGKALDDEESDDGEGLELEEVVVCTLDPEKNYQQPIDFVVTEKERIFFKVTGTHTVYLTGNYLLPIDEEESDEEDSDDEGYDYDLPPDMDELALMDEDDESDELDDLENPRITEIDSEEEKEVEKKSKKDAKGKKRPAEDEMDLDEMVSKDKAQPEQKLSKKQQKKLKKNNGEAAEAKAVEAVKEADKKGAKESPKSDKKVQFAKNLEQGPTGSTAKKDNATGTLGVKTVQGVTVDDRKLGSGRVAKKGDRVSMRYIGKLDNGKVFDSNKKGKPFSFKLGVGEVIKGWDIGVAGMAAGGERRLVIPSHLAYGKSGVPGIPGGATLTFDVKLLEIK